jgi:S-adenosyl-L-methionine hydrolase (adenosine-forming)
MQIVTLLSDFGTQDASVAIVKAGLYQAIEGVVIADVSHEIRPFHREEAVYVLKASYDSFPKGSVHLVLVDLFYAVRPKLVWYEADGHVFLAPDNGILYEVFRGDSVDCMVYDGFAPSVQFTDWVRKCAQVIIAPRGKVGEAAEGWKPGRMTAPVVGKDARTDAAEDNTLVCDVLYVDHYQNITLNCTQIEFEEKRRGRIFELRLQKSDVIDRISAAYGDVRDGDLLCRFNSSGFLEVSIRNGRAAQILGISPGSPNNDIKIEFK